MLRAARTCPLLLSTGIALSVLQCDGSSTVPAIKSWPPPVEQASRLLVLTSPPAVPRKSLPAGAYLVDAKTGEYTRWLGAPPEMLRVDLLHGSYTPAMQRIYWAIHYGPLYRTEATGQTSAVFTPNTRVCMPRPAASVSASSSQRQASLGRPSMLVDWCEQRAPERSPSHPIAISANGRFLAYVAGFGVNDSREGKVVIRDLDGLAPARIIKADHPNALALSPDGEHLAYTARRDTHEGVCELVFITQEDEEPQTQAVMLDDVHYLSWSPQGRYLAIAGHQKGSIDSQELWLVDLQQPTKRLQVLLPAPEDGQADPLHRGQIRGLAWSPQGDSLALLLDTYGPCKEEWKCDSSLYRVGMPALEVKRLSRQTQGNAQVFWLR